MRPHVLDKICTVCKICTICTNMQEKSIYAQYANICRYAKNMHNLLLFVPSESSSLSVDPADPQCMCC